MVVCLCGYVVVSEYTEGYSTTCVCATATTCVCVRVSSVTRKRNNSVQYSRQEK